MTTEMDRRTYGRQIPGNVTWGRNSTTSVIPGTSKFHRQFTFDRYQKRAVSRMKHLQKHAPAEERREGVVATRWLCLVIQDSAGCSIELSGNEY